MTLVVASHFLTALAPVVFNIVREHVFKGIKTSVTYKITNRHGDITLVEPVAWFLGDIENPLEDLAPNESSDPS